MFSIYLDEDASNRFLVSALRRAGFECLTTAEAKRQQTPDEDQLVFAASQARVMYTMNIGDFSRLHNQWVHDARSHSGIIICTDQHAPVGMQLRALQALAARFDAKGMEGWLEFLLNYA